MGVHILDQLNQQQDRKSDGVFDFIQGLTINTSNGRVIRVVKRHIVGYRDAVCNRSCLNKTNDFMFQDNSNLNNSKDCLFACFINDQIIKIIWS